MQLMYVIISHRYCTFLHNYFKNERPKIRETYLIIILRIIHMHKQCCNRTSGDDVEFPIMQGELQCWYNVGDE